MAKTKRLIKENLQLVDIVYEIIDARIPYSSKIQDIDNLLGNKPKILIMTKYDLCDKVETEKFVKFYQSKGYEVLTYDLINAKNLNRLYDLSVTILQDVLIKRQKKGLTNASIKALVVGIPNVGKSTLINKMIGKNKTITGNKPGVTKDLNWLKVNDNLYLLDSPGILWPKLNQDVVAYNLASMTAIKEDILIKQDIAIYIIKTLYKYYPEILKNNYGVIDISSLDEIYEIIGKKNGFLQKGGIIDYEKVTLLIINDMKSGRIKNITFDRL